LKPTLALERPYLEKNASQKRAGGVVQDVGPEFKPQYRKTKNKKKQRMKLLPERGFPGL
jgi:hypothetical protein